MDLFLPSQMSMFFAFAALGVAFFAGFIKGIVGFAMPLIMVSALSSFLDPKLALGLMILPVVASNTLQTFRSGIGPALDAIRDFRRYLLVVCIAIFAAAQLVTIIPTTAFYLVLGIPVVTLCLIQLAGWRPIIAPQHRHRAEWGIGLISGMLGGLAGTWGPTTVLFLMAIDTPRARQMVVQGVIYGAGAYALFFAHLNSGILNAKTAPLSLLLIVPAFLGMWAGFQLQDRMDANNFRRITLVVLIVMGLNMIRRGVGL